MRRIDFLATVTATVGLSLAGAGCSSWTTEKTKNNGAKTDQHGKHQHGKRDHTRHVKKNLAKLSEVHRASARKQSTCPVSGEQLGWMGVPKRVSVNGQRVWICSDGCKNAIEKDPDKYLARLKK